jgi:inner membrane protein
VLTLGLRRVTPGVPVGPVFLFLALCGLSHGLLDALTDGGLGVAFFSPFSNARYFFPWHPISVSPLSITRFLSGRAGPVLWSELLWVILPCIAIFLLGLRSRVSR